MSDGEPEVSGGDPGSQMADGLASSDDPFRTEARRFRERVRNEPGRKRRNRPDLRRFVRILLGRADEDGEDEH